MILELVRSIGSHFSHEQYMFWSRIQGTLWTAADIVLIVYLIRTTNLFRRHLGIRLHRWTYAVLGTTLPFAALVPVVQDARTFFYLELAVTIPHFLLILYLCFGDAGNALRALSSRARQ